MKTIIIVSLIVWFVLSWICVLIGVAAKMKNPNIKIKGSLLALPAAITIVIGMLIGAIFKKLFSFLAKSIYE